jgi:hypothetical protein
MRREIQSLILASLLCGTAAATEDLDAALEALKKKAHRHDYSSRAVLDNRELTVPSSLSEQDAVLDAKLLEMEQSLSREAPVQAQPMPRMAPMRALPRQEGNNNWLTPAMLDNSADLDGLQEDQTPWINQELERQKNRQIEQAALADEKELINRQVNDRLENPAASPFNPAAGYSRSLQEVISGRSENESRLKQSELKDPSGPQNPFAINSSASRSLIPSTPGLTPSSRTGLSSGIETFQIKRSTLKPPTDLNAKWDRDPEPLTPLNKLRKSSLIDHDPFSKDFAPSINKSIWD